MWKKVEKLLFEDRWRWDERAWQSWVELGSLRPLVLPSELGSTVVAARVVNTYQQARRGCKAVVDFGDPVGLQDTWWPGTIPPCGDWVVFETHLWRPPGTHSEEPVLWVDRWISTFSNSQKRRALRHRRRMQKLGRPVI